MSASKNPEMYPQEIKRLVAAVEANQFPQGKELILPFESEAELHVFRSRFYYYIGALESEADKCHKKGNQLGEMNWRKLHRAAIGLVLRKIQTEAGKWALSVQLRIHDKRSKSILDILDSQLLPPEPDKLQPGASQENLEPEVKKWKKLVEEVKMRTMRLNITEEMLKELIAKEIVEIEENYPGHWVITNIEKEMLKEYMEGQK